MASQQQIYETKILLNSEQAKKEINALEKKVEDLRRKRQEALDAGDTKSWQKLNKEVEKHETKLRSMQGRIESVNKTLDNMSVAGPKQLKETIKDINDLLNSGDIERGSRQWDSLTAAMREAKAELVRIKTETKATESVWGRFIGFLNKNWGAITQIIGSLTGLTMTVRKSVQDFATMEEEMANVRKYTGLADESVRELNEDLKEMDTRTKREDLNKLAGAAGRLGIQTKEGALEFVDGANMIRVSLGDDLGEEAVDQIGKLTMAFGEDEKMGLRGAMLATGSAVNELAQNSPARAGFLVDFTARVAGFGKQIGLTQAQIMGFGAVMDENLLRDEMAATAFGNMLTKMQTDAEKFARIAGQSVEDFTKLLNEDANQAILNLADSLRSQDPQTMMKMLDDMGLDGSRAVGVLSTLADKIDDVRDRQKLATDAYMEATSITKEYEIMNNTVEARLEKCKNKFHEMSIELGEQLVPVVKYTCTGFSLLVKGLSTGSKFVAEHKTEIIAASAAIVAYTAYVNASTIATKLHTAATKAAEIATKAFNLITKMNPIGLLIAALTAAVVLFIKYRNRINGAGEAMAMLRNIAAKLMNALAILAQRFINLINWTVSLYDKFAFLRKIFQLLVTSFTTGFTTITLTVKLLIDELDAVGTIIEGIFTLDWGKIKDGFSKGFKAIADAAVALFYNVKRTVKETFSAPPPPRSGGEPVSTGTEEPTVEKTLPEVVVKPQKRQAYISEADLKRQEREKRKAEADRKKQEAEKEKELREAEKAAKAESDARIAAKTHEYAIGKIAYRQYIQDMAALQEEGLKNRRDVYSKGSAEYERLNRQLQELSFKGDQKVNQLKLEDLQRCMTRQQLEIEAQAAREEITEDEKQERLRILNETFLADKVELYKEGTLERMNAEWDLEQAEQRNKIEREKFYQQQLDQVRQQYLGMSNERMLQTALSGLDSLHERGLIKEEEYQRTRIAIQAQYANTQTPSEQTRRTADDMLTNARSAAAPENNNTPIFGTIQNYQTVIEKLKELYAEDKQNHEAYLLAKQQATAQFCETFASEIQTAYNTVNQMMSATSSYFSSLQDYEVAMVQKRYEKQIEAAGNNQKKVKKLQEKQQKEEAAIKTKYNKRQMVIQMAQAAAQTAVNVIQAYGAGLSIGGPAAPITAAAFAAMALAAGMIQIATLKKQQQAQEAGYFEGGFTGGKRYRREAGVVHEGEFVANHQAVNNPNVLPFLSFLDQAQKNNTVGSLTAQDISRSMGAGGSAQIVAPVVNVNNDNEELRDSIERSADVNEQLLDIIEKKGIQLDFPMDSFHQNYKHFLKLHER